VVELVDHLGLVERHVASAVRQCPVGAVALPTRGVQIGEGAEQGAVVGHVQHPHELDAPGVTGGTVGLVDEHRDSAVDAFRQLRVGLAAKDGAGTGVGVQQPDVFGRQAETPIRVLDLICLSGEEHEHGRLGSASAAHGQKTEPVGMMHRRKDELLVLEGQ